MLAEAYVGMERGRRLEEAIENVDEIDMADFTAPKDLQKRVELRLKETPTNVGMTPFAP